MPNQEMLREAGASSSFWTTYTHLMIQAHVLAEEQ